MFSGLKNFVNPPPKEDEVQRKSKSLESLNLPSQLDKGAKLTGVLSQETEEFGFQALMKANEGVFFSMEDIEGRDHERLQSPMRIARARKTINKKEEDIAVMEARLEDLALLAPHDQSARILHRERRIRLKVTYNNKPRNNNNNKPPTNQMNNDDDDDVEDNMNNSDDDNNNNNNNNNKHRTKQQRYINDDSDDSDSGNRYKPNRTIIQPKKRARSPPPRPLPPADHINNPNAKQRGKAYSSNNLGDGPVSSTSSSSYRKCSHCDVLSHELRYPLRDGCELGVCRTCLTNPKLFLACEWCGDAVFTPTKRKFSKREIAEREATGSCLHNFQTYKW